MAEQIRAWLLTPPGLPPFAVGQHEVMQYLNSAPIQPMPLALRHCAAAIFWQDEMVPVMNLSVLNGSPEPVRDLAVLAYQDTPGTPLQYVALALRKAPERITVDDTSSCDLPADNAELWKRIAVACFTRNSQPTPIISIQRLCSAEFRDFAAQQLTHSPAPVMQAILSPSPLMAVPTPASSIPQSEPGPVMDVRTTDASDGLAENLGQNQVDVLDDALDGEFDSAETDDDLDRLDTLGEDDAELDLDDDLNDMKTLDDALDDTEDLADTADLEDDTELDADESLDDAAQDEDGDEDEDEDEDDVLDDDLDAEDRADTADPEDDMDLDGDESLDDAAWLEDDDDAKDRADTADPEDDTDLDGDESLDNELELEEVSVA